MSPDVYTDDVMRGVRTGFSAPADPADRTPHPSAASDAAHRDVQALIARAAQAAVAAGRGVMDADDGADGLLLPPQYDEALLLAEHMLAAARCGDWDTVKQLRTALPKLARDLEVAWQELRTVYPDACALLEGQRVKMIREILRVDELIRQRAASPAWQRVQPMLATRPMGRSAQADLPLQRA